MPNTLTLTLFTPAEPLQLRRAVNAATYHVVTAVLFVGRFALLAFIAYAGSIIVQHVTEALCVATAHKPPGWSLGR
jgi:hypothetical protein